MPTVRIHVKNLPGVSPLPACEFNPMRDDDASQPIVRDGVGVTPSRCCSYDVEIPDGLTIVEPFPGYKQYVETPDGIRMSACDIIAALIRGTAGYRLVGA